MRFVTILAVLVCLLAGVWIGGETYLARRVEAALGADAPADSPLAAQGVSPLREPARIGLHLTTPRMESGTGDLWTAAGADLWISPLEPTRFNLALLDRLKVQQAQTFGQTLEFDLTGVGANVRVSPLHSFRASDAALRADTVTLDGAPLIKGAQITARLLAPTGDEPAGATYAVDVTLDELDPTRLAEVLRATPPEGKVALRAKAQVRLAQALGPIQAAGGNRLMALRLDDSDLRMGEMSARVMGHLRANPQGLAEGEVMIYTADSDKIIETAVEHGALPPKAAPLAKTMLTGIGKSPPVKGAPVPEMDFPAPRPGEIRLPLIFRAGKAMLGPMPLGDAPRFPG